VGVESGVRINLLAGEQHKACEGGCYPCALKMKGLKGGKSNVGWRWGQGYAKANTSC